MWQDKMQKYYDEWVTQKALPWFYALEQREQHVLMVAAVLIPLVIFIFGLMLPMLDKQESLRSDMIRLAQQSSDATRYADQLQKHGTKPARGGSGLSLIDNTSRSQGMKKYITRLRPQTGAAGSKVFLLQMRDAPYAKTIRFIATLTEQGLTLSGVKLRPADTSGYVQVQLMLKGR